MVILVTGATGLVGLNLTKKLVEKGEKIRVLIRASAEKKELEKLGVEIIEGNLGNSETVEKAMKNSDIVFHVAAAVKDTLPDEEFYEVNHKGTKNVVKAFVKEKGKKFIYVSTIGIYGFKQKNVPIKEDNPLELIKGYRESKWLGEKEVLEAAKKEGFFATVIRPPPIFGPYDRQLAPEVWRMIEKGKRLPLINKGKTILPFCYVEDLTDALIKASEKEEARGEVFNVVGFHATSKEFFEEMGKILKKKPKFFRSNYYVAMAIVGTIELVYKMLKKKPKVTRIRLLQFGKSRKFDTKKIEEKIGFEPKYDLKTAVEETYHWYKKIKEKEDERKE